jgi:hypothetical protein
VRAELEGAAARRGDVVAHDLLRARGDLEGDREVGALGGLEEVVLDLDGERAPGAFERTSSVTGLGRPIEKTCAAWRRR